MRVREAVMDAADIKKQLHAMPFCSKAVATGAIVDILLDKMAAGDPIDPQAMATWMADMVRFAEKHVDRIERRA